MPVHPPRRRNVTFIVSPDCPSLMGMAEVATSIAAADGLAHPAEIALLRQIRDRLGLNGDHPYIRLA